MAEKYTYTDNGIVFNIDDNAKMAFSKITNMDGSIKNEDIVPIINSVEIDWNSAQLQINGDTANRTINTTGDLLNAIKDASFIGNTNAQNIGGVQGPTGAQGSIGIQGKTGAFGATGALGRTGAQGPTGSSGRTGIQGKTGVQGLIGMIGSQGLPGIPGSTGIQGKTGVLGATGALGRTGLQGATGSFGRTGAQGTTGAQGPISSEFEAFKTEVNTKLAEIYSRLATLEVANN